MRRISMAALLRIPSLVALLSLIALAAIPYKPPFGEWKRLHGGEPILVLQGDGWEAAEVFNPTVIEKDGKIIMIYRAQDKQRTSRLGYAESTDGIHFVRRPEPVLSPEAPYEKVGGCEDPRIVKFGDRYYLTYTGWNRVGGKRADKSDGQLCLATSKDLTERPWEKFGQVPNLIFVEGIVRRGKRWLFYYNGGEKHTGVAEAWER